MHPIATFSLGITFCLVALVAPHQAQLAGWPAAVAAPQLQPQFLQQPQPQPQPQTQPQQLQAQPQPQQLGQFDSSQLAAASLQAGTTNPPSQLVAPDLQNQVQALGAQLAAANRQIQFYQQQLAGQQQQPQATLPQQQQPQQVPSQPLNQPMSLQLQQQQQLQQQLQQQQQLQAALAQQQQHLAIQQQQQQQPQFSPFGGQQVGAQQQPAQFPSAQPQFQPAQQPQAQQPQQPQTLIDNSATALLAGNPRLAGQPQFLQQQQLLQQQQAAQFEPSRSSFLSAGQQVASQQQQQAQSTTSSSVEPASIEPSLAPQQPAAASAQQPAAAKDDDKFSIGLGVLSPGYTQKFGNTALDFNQDKNSFSFTLSNRDHSNVPPPTPTLKPASN